MGLGWGVGGNKKTRGIYLPTYLPTRRVGLSAVVVGKKKKKKKKRVLCGSRPVPVSLTSQQYVGSRTT